MTVRTLAEPAPRHHRPRHADGGVIGTMNRANHGIVASKHHRYMSEDSCDDTTPHNGTVTLIEKCSGAVGFEAVAMEHRWVVHISGGSVGRGDLTPDREAVGHLGSPFGRAEQMPSRPKVCGDAAEGGQEPLRMPRRFEAFHRPFALPGGLMRVLGAVVQILRPPVLHRRHELAVSDLVAGQLVGDQHARHVPQALEQLDGRIAWPPPRFGVTGRECRARCRAGRPRATGTAVLPLIPTNTSSRCHLSPGRGRRRRSWLA